MCYTSVDSLYYTIRGRIIMTKRKHTPILVHSDHEFQNGDLEIRKNKKIEDSSGLHWHDFYELEIITSGEGFYYINGVEYPLKRGAAYLVSPVDFHLIKGNLEVCNIAFKESAISHDVFEKVLSIENSGVVMFDKDEFLFMEKGIDMLSAESEKDALLHDRMLTALLDSLLVGYLRKTEATSDAKNRSDIVVMRVVSYIKFHFKKKITLAEVADAVGLTPNYVGEIFAKRMGVSFNAYLMQTRLNYAKTLLMRGDCTVEDVAMLSGFGSQTYFSDCFKKQFGTTPTAVKKNAAQGILFADGESE